MPSDEITTEQAERVLRQEYWEAVRQIARDSIHEARESGRDVSDVVHEAVDSSYWVIYTHANLQVLRFTENDEAAADIGGLDEILRDRGVSGLYQILAFYALRADVEEQISRMDGEDETEEPDGDA